ncbi:MAG: hypothetical protein N4A72_19620 [Bacteroidales bacterium]|jgi:hypothetical protein|nr:hypothetical protein [Bacteroidales bacterium]
MRKFKILLVLITFLGLSSVTEAHPPKKVIAKYNKESAVLTIEIIHSVKEATSHYIDAIVIYKNGEEISKLKPSEQTGKEKHTETMILKDLKSGDLIKVKAKCNKFGSKTAKLKID